MGRANRFDRCIRSANPCRLVNPGCKFRITVCRCICRCKPLTRAMLDIGRPNEKLDRHVGEIGIANEMVPVGVSKSLRIDKHLQLVIQ